MIWPAELPGNNDDLGTETRSSARWGEEVS